MNLDIDTLRHTWRETAPRVRFRPYPEVDDEGLHYGTATLLATRRLTPGSADEARAYALLSVAAGRPTRLDSLRFLHRALAQWERGEKALAQFELAFARFPRLAARDDAWPLFCADALITGGVAPETLLRKLGLAENAEQLIRSVADEPRVPAGHGRQSGEWTTGDHGAKPPSTSPKQTQSSRGPNNHQQHGPPSENGDRVSGHTLAIGNLTPHTKEPVKAFDVGPANELHARSIIRDDLEIHHAIQAHPAQRVVSSYDRSTAPAIAIPRVQHKKVPRISGVYDGPIRDLLARDIYNLRRHTDAPRTALQKLIELNKTTYPSLFEK